MLQSYISRFGHGSTYAYFWQSGSGYI